MIALGLAVLADTYYYQGNAVCPECNGETPTINCALSGSYDGAWRCYTIADTTSITCRVKDGENVIAETTTNCPSCSGTGGGGGGGGSGGQCDPTLPLWWVFCDPWAM